VRAAVELGSKGLELREKSLEAARAQPLPQGSSHAGKVVRRSLDGGQARTRTPQRGPGFRPGPNGRRPFELDWREPRVLTIDVLDEDGERRRGEPIVYEVTLGDASVTMDLLVGTLRLLGVCHARLVLFVSDGATWIWNRIAEALEKAGVAPERRRLVLDYFHATEHISAALAACKSLGAAARETLFEELRRILLEPGGAQAVIERLAPLARGRRGRAISAEIEYLTAHLAHMRYAELRAENLSIGSGVVESAVRRLNNLRFKAASMCWRPDHLEPLLYLRAILKAGHWDRFFRSQLQRRHWLEALRSSADTTPAQRKFA
jgi:hypothetical protein